MTIEFADSWLWLIFVIVGLFLAILELIIGVETGYDLVIIGSAFIVAGIATWPAHSWLSTVGVTSVISVAYVAVGRRYIHRWTAVKKERTNIDAIIDTHGIVLQSITRNAVGLVQVRNEQWRARAEEDIEKGDEIVVTSVSGVTLIVEKIKGGSLE
jgi:membrane protein implicated in regulation of membrane protease activity